jgi:hypothetical protein
MLAMRAGRRMVVTKVAAAPILGGLAGEGVDAGAGWGMYGVRWWRGRING